jgi:predicted transposase/invertase (TIGR01784 family)
MPRYLDPKSDFVFKKVFGKHPALLKSFLNAVLPLPEGGHIESLEYLSAENVPDLPKVEKRSIVDVRCYDQKGRHFIVEMQMAWSRHFMQRFLFNIASVYVRQLKIAENYTSLNPVYGLAIVAESFSEEKEWFHHYRFVHGKNQAKTLDDIQLVLLELPKFVPKSIADRRMTVLWLRFMTEIDESTRTVDAALLTVPEIKAALALVEEAAYTPEELEANARNWDAIRTERMLMDDKFEEGEAKGRAEGRAEGRVEGKAEGRAEGRAEGITQILEAVKHIQAGESNTFIHQKLGLSLEELAALRQQMHLDTE